MKNLNIASDFPTTEILEYTVPVNDIVTYEIFKILLSNQDIKNYQLKSSKEWLVEQAIEFKNILKDSNIVN
jgi:hypothetical protein